MIQAVSVAIDLAKTVFRLHGASRDGAVVFRRRLTRSRLLDFARSLPKCVIAMAAWAGAHHWGRVFSALGHAVRLLAPIYVKPFVKRQSEADQETILGIVFPPNATVDAEAIAEVSSWLRSLQTIRGIV